MSRWWGLTQKKWSNLKQIQGREEWWWAVAHSFKSARLFVYGRRQGNSIDILVRDEWKRGRGLKSRVVLWCTVPQKSVNSGKRCMLISSNSNFSWRVFELESTAMMLRPLHLKQWRKILNKFIRLYIFQHEGYTIYLHLRYFFHF